MTQSFTAKNEFVVNHFGRPFGEICRRQKWEDRFCIYFGNPLIVVNYKGNNILSYLTGRGPKWNRFIQRTEICQKYTKSVTYGK